MVFVMIFVVTLLAEMNIMGSKSNESYNDVWKFQI